MDKLIPDASSYVFFQKGSSFTTLILRKKCTQSNWQELLMYDDVEVTRDVSDVTWQRSGVRI